MPTKTQFLTLKQLRFIEALQRRGKMGLAAEDMHMSQPAASRALSDIEALLGRQICARNAHGFVFNEFGEALAVRAKRVINEMDNLGRDLSELADGLRGRVHVGAVTTAAIAYVVPASLALRAIAPDVQIQIDVEPSAMLMRRMREGTYDFVLGRLTPDDDPSLYDIRRIGEETLRFAVRSEHPLASRKKLTFADLSAFDWVMQPAGAPSWSAVAEAFALEGAEFPSRVTYSASILLTLAIVARTNAIAPFADEVAHLLTAEDLSANIVALDMAGEAVVSSFNIILPRNELLSPLARRFLQLVQAEVDRR
ncbi:MAG: LysR family transcriptional regulator [Mesorhizobium sp.]